MPNAELLRKVGLSLPSDMLRVQRLNWLQDMVKKTLRNVQCIGAMFGTSEWEGHPSYDEWGERSGKVHDFALQMEGDLRELASHSELDGRLEDVLRKPSLLFTHEYVRDAFVSTDTRVLPAARKSACVPPPGTAREGIDLPSDLERRFVCQLSVGGAPCCAAFATNQALQMHIVKSRKTTGSEAWLEHSLSQTTVSYVGTFSPQRKIAAGHLIRTLDTGVRPRGDGGSCTVFDHLTEPPYTCRACAVEFDNIITAQAHLSGHLPPEQLEVWI